MSLVLFFTRGVSLETWDERRILARETALYRKLAERVGGITFITYGGRADLRYEPRLGGIAVEPNRRELPIRAYGQLLPVLHRKIIQRAAVLKTNQIYGGMAALHAARLYKRPLIARCGFLWSEVADAEDGAGSLRARFVANRERTLLRNADAVVVTTHRLAARVVERHGVARGKIAVIPNFVDTSRFRPLVRSAEPRSLIFVGRLSREKNLQVLIEAVAAVDGTSLTIAGDGPLRRQLEEFAAAREADVRFVGRVPHEELPALLRQAELFVIPSLYEGHPKAMIEAMACGLPVIGADVPGIRDTVAHGRTGLLCPPTRNGLTASIKSLLSDEPLRAALGAAAAEVASEFSIDRILGLELELIDGLSGKS